MKINKKIILLTLVGSLMLVLGGCDVTGVLDNYAQAIIEEGNYNSDCVDKLVRAGIVEESHGKTLKDNIASTVDKYAKVKDVSNFSGDSKDSVKWVIGKASIETAVTRAYNEYYSSFTSDSKSTQPEPSFSKIKKLTNSKIKVGSHSEWKKKGGRSFVEVTMGEPVIKVKKSPTPIPYLSMGESNMAYFENKSALPVYVLKSSGYNDKKGRTYKDKDWYDKKYGDQSYTDYASMDKLLQALSGLKSNENTIENEKIVREFFTDSGTELTAKKKFITNGTLDFKSDGITSLKLAVVRFDAAAIESVYGSLENKEGKYFVYNGIAYLLEYPVHYVKDLKATEDGGTNWEVVTAPTDMRVNFYSGELLDKDGKAISKEGTEDPIYHVDPATGSSSFMFGTKLMTYEGIGHSKTEVKNCLQILLKDYLEYLYLPEVVENEKFIALGRRIRIDSLKGNLSTPIGHFIDKKGKSSGGGNILPTDIISIYSGVADSDREDTKIKLALKYKASKPNKIDNTGTESGMIEESKLLLLTEYKTKFRMTYPMPWTGTKGVDDIASTDIGNKYIKGPQLYGIATDINLFDSGLYESWVNITGDGGEVGSLEWWNSWLESNNYRYRIYMSNLKEALGHNYSYEMADSGTIILDIDTITKIQDDYNKDKSRETVKGVRTSFLVLGTLLIAYSMLIPAAWLYDVNVTNGPRLLTKMSFGNWIAVSNSDEIPNIGGGGKQYYNFGSVITKAMVICAVGILLYLLDFVEIVGVVWSLFGALVDTIKKVVFNLF